MWITGAKQLDDGGCSRWMDCACADGKSAAVGWDRCGWVAGGRQLKQLEPVVQWSRQCWPRWPRQLGETGAGFGTRRLLSRWEKLEQCLDRRVLYALSAAPAAHHWRLQCTKILKGRHRPFHCIGTGDTRLQGIFSANNSICLWVFCTFTARVSSRDSDVFAINRSILLSLS